MGKKARKPRKQRTTVEKYKFWRNWNYGLEAGKFAMPCIPFGIILGINWSDWVGDSASEGWSIGLGFGMLIVATVSAMLAIFKKDEIAKQKMSGVFYVAIVFAVIGFSFKLLATIANTFGDMFLYVSLGIVGSATVDQIDKSAIRPRQEFYKNLIESNGLSRKSAQLMDDTEQAKEEGEKAKAERAEKKKRNYL